MSPENYHFLCQLNQNNQRTEEKKEADGFCVVFVTKNHGSVANNSQRSLADQWTVCNVPAQRFYNIRPGPRRAQKHISIDNVDFFYFYFFCCSVLSVGAVALRVYRRYFAIMYVHWLTYRCPHAAPKKTRDQKCLTEIKKEKNGAFERALHD